jgi:hypothetical protein
MNNNIIPKFILAAQPNEKIYIPDFFVESEDNIFFEKLRKPTYLRYMGWNLLTLDYPKIKNGTYWEVKNGDRKTIKLYRDGALVAIGDANEEFLGWGANSHDKYVEYPNLLALALIEYVYEFVELYKIFIEKFPEVKNILIKFGFKNVDTWDGKRLILKPQEVSSLVIPNFDNEKRNFINKDFINEISVTTENNTYNSQIVAYRIVSDIFTTFNIPVDKIPYITENELGQKVIDIEKIKKIG